MALSIMSINCNYTFLKIFHRFKSHVSTASYLNSYQQQFDGIAMLSDRIEEFCNVGRQKQAERVARLALLLMNSCDKNMNGFWNPWLNFSLF